MIVHLDTASPVPVFEQLRSQIERLISSSQLPPGSKLPPIRRLANDLGVARGTVNKVYDMLARDGLVETSGRHGTIVLDSAHLTTTAGDLNAAADTMAMVVHQLNLSASHAQQALAEAMQRLDSPSTPLQQ